MNYYTTRARSNKGKRGRWWNENPPGTHEFICECEVLMWRLTDTEFLEEYMSMATFGKMFGKSSTQAGQAAAADADTEARWPNVFLLLTATVNDQGRPRKPGMLTVVCEQGLFKAGLKERDLGMSLWRSGETLAGVLTALDEALESGQADWRVQESHSRK